MNLPSFDSVKSKFIDLKNKFLGFCKTTFGKIKLSEFKFNDLKKVSSEFNRTRFNKLVRSVVALCLMLVLLVTSTLSWLMSNFTSDVTTNDEFITITADAGLEMNYGDKDNNQGTINIENVKLTECSSIDGRNFFFPLSEYSSKGDKEFVDNVNTNDLVFREGTANDKNKNYISVNFSLSAQNETDIWLSNETSISCTVESNKTADAVRVAFVENKVGGKSTVFDNATDKVYVEKNQAVKTVAANGELENTAECQTHAFNEYYFGNEDKNTLFHIEAGEELNITMNIWLEGTDAHCTSSVLNLSDLNIFIKFTTSFEDVRTLYFIDHTIEKWVDDTDCYVFVIDEKNVHHRMTKSDNYDNDYSWSVSLPTTVKDIRFTRYNPEDADMEWNYWEAGTLGTCTTYNAFGHSAGMWSESFSGTTITLFDGTPNGYLDDNDALMHVDFSCTDGNGNKQDFNYKMSYQNDRHRWQIVIPTEVRALKFERYNKTQDTVWGDDWPVSTRGDKLYYTITSGSTGYWSNNLIYLDAESYKSGCTFVSYFYESSDDKSPVWTAMRSTTPEKGRYIAAVPDGKVGVVFCRYNSNATEFKFGSNVYNQLDSSLEKFGTNNLFIMSGYNSNDDMTGKWYYSDSP